jgi:hypothetical protein
MKQLKLYLWVLLTIAGFTACEDAKDPIISQGALDGSISFQLNEPQYKNWTYVLTDANAEKDMDYLTCVQPAYGFTAAVTYTTQVSFTNTFATGTFEELPTTVNGEKVGINTKEMDKAIIALYGGKLPEPVVEKEIYIRLKAFISDATVTPLEKTLTVKPLYSNSIKIKVLPYVLPLFPYYESTPRLWYIVGLGDGGWNNSVAGLGKSLIPMSITAGKKYNLSGDGEFVFTGYFSASRSFKIIRDIGDWSIQWGNKGSDGINNPINKAIAGEEPSNFKVPADGYYKITLNSIENTVTFEALSITPSLYSKIGLIGAFNGWAADVELTATETTNNHIWYTTYTFAEDSQCKLRANGSWDTNWGTEGSSDGDNRFSAMGIGVGGGKNMVQTAGTYIVIFNDIDGVYYFIKK